MVFDGHISADELRHLMCVNNYVQYKSMMN